MSSVYQEPHTGRHAHCDCGWDSSDDEAPPPKRRQKKPQEVTGWIW